MSIQELLMNMPSGTSANVLLTPTKEMPLILSSRFQKNGSNYRFLASITASDIPDCHQTRSSVPKKKKALEHRSESQSTLDNHQSKDEKVEALNPNNATETNELEYAPFKLKPNSSFNPSKLTSKQLSRLDPTTLAKYEAYSLPTPEIMSKVLKSECRAKIFINEGRRIAKLKEMESKKKWNIIHCGYEDEEAMQLGERNSQKAKERMQSKLHQIVSHRNAELKCLIEGQSSALEAIRLKEFLVPPRRLKLSKIFTEKDKVRNFMIPNTFYGRSASIIKRCMSSYQIDGTSRKKVTVRTIKKLYSTFIILRIGNKEPITVMTAHDFPSATYLEQAGIEICLVGDSLAQVALGYANTNQITLDEMMHHSRAVARGIKTCFIVGDLPFGSYETSPAQAINSSVRYLKEGAVHAVKLEGGAEMSQTIAQITKIGIPVLGHIGLTPQRVFSLGGFTVQGKSLDKAKRLYSDALALQEAGCFAIVLEAIPEEVATLITSKLSIPTIGIGAGPTTSGQVLVQMDALKSNFAAIPKFCQQFGDIGTLSVQGLANYRAAVKTMSFPVSESHTYPMPPIEKEKLSEWIQELDKNK